LAWCIIGPRFRLALVCLSKRPDSHRLCHIAWSHVFCFIVAQQLATACTTTHARRQASRSKLSGSSAVTFGEHRDDSVACDRDGERFRARAARCQRLRPLLSLASQSSTITGAVEVRSSNMAATCILKQRLHSRTHISACNALHDGAGPP
jgi:hypothetical protein